MIRRSVLVLTLVLLTAGTVAAQGLQIQAAPADTVPVTDGELRGLTWLDDIRRVALVARPDSLDADAAPAVSLVWYEGDAVVREEDQTGRLTRGLAYDGKFLWSLGQPVGSPDAVLYKLEGDTLYVDGEYPAPGHAVRDLAWDGTHVWMVDRDRGRLERFDPETEEVTRSVNTPGFSPVGVASDGRHLWVADKGTGRLYRLSPGGSVWNGTVAENGFMQRGREVQLVHDGARLWALPEAGGLIWELRFGGKTE